LKSERLTLRGDCENAKHFRLVFPTQKSFRALRDRAAAPEKNFLKTETIPSGGFNILTHIAANWVKYPINTAFRDF